MLEALHAKASPKADELVIPNTYGLPYMSLDEGPLKGGSAGIWNRLREVSGVEGVAMRDMRHYFSVSCLSRGIPLSTVGAWMGHSDINLTSKRYGRFAADAREQWPWAALRAEPVEPLQLPLSNHRAEQLPDSTYMCARTFHRCVNSLARWQHHRPRHRAHDEGSTSSSPATHVPK